MIKIRIEEKDNLFQDENKAKKLLANGHKIGDPQDFLHYTILETVDLDVECLFVQAIAKLIGMTDHPHTKDNIPRFERLLSNPLDYYTAWKNSKSWHNADWNKLLRDLFEFSEVQRRILMEDFKQTIEYDLD